LTELENIIWKSIYNTVYKYIYLFSFTTYQLSLGDAHSYLLTTAENELGVVMATSEAGKMLFMNTNINNY
jgi:hypothetical protein